MHKIQMKLVLKLKNWIESLSQSPEVALPFSQMKEETPLKQIAAEAAKISKNKEIVLHKPKSLKNVLKETSPQDVFPKEIAVSSQTASDQTTAKFLQAKSTVSAMLAQAKTNKEFKKLMAEMLSSLDSKSEDEKSSASSIKTVDLVDDTTSVTITKTKKKL
ncbi:hypothetical protein Gotur_019758, partial [Gossypium turneri]